MARRHSAAFRLSLVAVLCGVCALCMPSGTHAREVARGVLVRHVMRHVDLLGFGTTDISSGHLRQVSHGRLVRALPRSSAPASLFKKTCIVTPDFAESLLARENVLALGGAPRAPGPSRAPPAA